METVLNSEEEDCPRIVHI